MQAQFNRMSTKVDIRSGAQRDTYSFEAMTSTMHGSKFRSTQRPIFLAINHGANRDVYGGLDYTMLLSAHTHRIDVTSVLAHSTTAPFFSF